MTKLQFLSENIYKTITSVPGHELNAVAESKSLATMPTETEMTRLSSPEAACHESPRSVMTTSYFNPGYKVDIGSNLRRTSLAAFEKVGSVGQFYESDFTVTKTLKGQF
jgi:hypothetical protein